MNITQPLFKVGTREITFYSTTTKRKFNYAHRAVYAGRGKGEGRGIARKKDSGDGV